MPAPKKKVLTLKIALPEANKPEAVAQMLIGQLFAGFLRHIFEPDLDTEIIRRQATVALKAVVLD